MKFINSTLVLILSLFLSLVLTSSCDTTDPPSNKKITLEFEDASCTEAWLNLKLDNISLPAEININTDDSTFLTANINSNDTTLFIENLQPNQTYSFHSTIHPYSQSILKSNSVSVTTMDTTSHNFTWETFEFGGINGSSYFSDVAIINENNIWAVGEIHTEDTDKFDSNGVWVQPYNAVHWNGNTWEFERIGGYGYGEYNVVYAFSENDVWFGGFIKWDGEKYTVHTSGFPFLPNGDGWRIKSMWGTSSQDFYVVGNGGNIAHYNGSNWTKIESGTELDINDILGDYNDKMGKWEIMAVATDFVSNSGRFLLAIDNNQVKHLDVSPIVGRLQSLWFESNRKYYLVGSGIYTKENLSNSEWKKLPREVSEYFQETISAQSLNDIIITGHFNEVLHFNGVSWKSYRGKEISQESGVLYGSDYKVNSVAIVGSNGREALLYIGKR